VLVQMRTDEEWTFRSKQALPAIFIFEGETVRKLPDWEMNKM
jgi:hypothetical protein